MDEATFEEFRAPGTCSSAHRELGEPPQLPRGPRRRLGELQGEILLTRGARSSLEAVPRARGTGRPSRASSPCLIDLRKTQTNDEFLDPGAADRHDQAGRRSHQMTPRSQSGRHAVSRGWCALSRSPRRRRPVEATGQRARAGTSPRSGVCRTWCWCSSCPGLGGDQVDPLDVGVCSTNQRNRRRPPGAGGSAPRPRQGVCLVAHVLHQLDRRC